MAFFSIRNALKICYIFLTDQGYTVPWIQWCSCKRYLGLLTVLFEKSTQEKRTSELQDLLKYLGLLYYHPKKSFGQAWFNSVSKYLPQIVPCVLLFSCLFLIQPPKKFMRFRFIDVLFSSAAASMTESEGTDE